jgi:hypothetical protein
VYGSFAPLRRVCASTSGAASWARRVTWRLRRSKNRAVTFEDRSVTVRMHPHSRGVPPRETFQSNTRLPGSNQQKTLFRVICPCRLSACRRLVPHRPSPPGSSSAVMQGPRMRELATHPQPEQKSTQPASRVFSNVSVAVFWIRRAVVMATIVMPLVLGKDLRQLRLHGPPGVVEDRWRGRWQWLQWRWW